MASTASGEAMDDIIRILNAKGHLDVLSGITRTSSDDDVRKAYRNMALRTHPDKNKHERAEEAFKRVHSAFQALETQDKRDSYIRRGGTGFSNGQDDDHFAGFHGAASEEEFFNIFMGGGVRFGGFPMGGFPMGGNRSRGVNMDDIIMMMMMQEMFGGRGGFGMQYHEEDDDDGFYEEEDQFEYEDQGIVQDVTDAYYCTVCDVNLGRSELRVDAHIESRRHRLRSVQMRQAQEDEEDEEEEEDDDDEEEEGDEYVTQPDGLTFDPSTQQYVCELCDVFVATKKSMMAHLEGKKHQKALSSEHAKRYIYRCDACDVETTTSQAMDQHVAGKRHAKNMAKKH